jgi:hypothetical protein
MGRHAPSGTLAMCRTIAWALTEWNDGEQNWTNSRAGKWIACSAREQVVPVLWNAIEMAAVFREGRTGQAVAPRQFVPRELEELASEGSSLARKHQVHLHSAGIASVPENYDERLTELFPGRFGNIRLFVADPWGSRRNCSERGIRSSLAVRRRRIPRLSPAHFAISSAESRCSGPGS